MKQFYPLSAFLTEYSEKNDGNKYRPVAVGRYGIRPRESIYSKELAKDYSKNKLIHKNTLTVGMGSVQIDIGILTEDITYSVSPAYHTYRITGIDATYLRYCLECRNQDMFARFVKRGSRQGKIIDLKRWLTYEIPVYDMVRQAEIVDRLDRILGLIEKRKEQLLQLDQLVKSRFIEMFGNETEFDKWPCCTVGDVADVYVGVVIKPTQYYADKGIPAFRSLNIGKMYVKDSDWVYFTEEGNQKNQKSVVHKNDVLVIRSGAPGTACVVTEKYDGYNAVDIIIAHPDGSIVNPIFLAAFTNMPHGMKQIRERTGGAAQQHFNVGGYKALKLIKPPLNLQEEFAAFVAQTDKSKYRQEKCIGFLQCFEKNIRQEWL